MCIDELIRSAFIVFEGYIHLYQYVQLYAKIGCCQTSMKETIKPISYFANRTQKFLRSFQGKKAGWRENDVCGPFYVMANGISKQFVLFAFNSGGYVLRFIIWPIHVQKYTILLNGLHCRYFVYAMNMKWLQQYVCTNMSTCKDSRRTLDFVNVERFSSVWCLL